MWAESPRRGGTRDRQDNLIGRDGSVTFKIITGPASNTAPKGMTLFKAVTYVAQCSQRRLNRGRVDERDKSELVIEGYQEPRIGADGKPFIAVVALAVASKNQQSARKLEQLCEVGKAEDAYNAVCDQFGDDSAQAQAAAEAFEKLNANLVRFMASRAGQSPGGSMSLTC